MWYLFTGCASGATSSPSAATACGRTVGITVSATVIWAHAISGLLAAVAGMMLVARLQIGQPTIGDDWLISSFAAPVIGGAVLTGGHVSVAGTFFGVVIIAIITQALVLFAIDPFVVQIVLGGLILWAVGINRLRELRVAKLNDGALEMTALQVSPRVSKSFPGVKALDDVSMTLKARLDPRAARRERRGQVDPDQDHHRRSPGRRGEVTMDGKPCASPIRARRRPGGLGVVHQERNLVPRFSVAENIMLDRLGEPLALAGRTTARSRRGRSAG